MPRARTSDDVAPKPPRESTRRPAEAQRRVEAEAAKRKKRSAQKQARETTRVFKPELLRNREGDAWGAPIEGDTAAFRTGYKPYRAMPRDPDRRVEMLRRVREYRAATGKNLLAQRDPERAYASAGLDWEAVRGGPRTAESRPPIDVKPGRTAAARSPLNLKPAGDGRRETPWWRKPENLLPTDLARGVADEFKGALPVYLARVAAAKAGVGEMPTDEPYVPLGSMSPRTSRDFQRNLGVGTAGIAKWARDKAHPTSDWKIDLGNIDFQIAADAYAAGDPQVEIEVEQLRKEGKGRYWLEPAEREDAKKSAERNGWKVDPAWDDWDLYRHAKQIKPGVGTRVAAGAAGDLAAMAAIPVGIAAAAQAAAGGPKSAAQFAYDTVVQPYVDLKEGGRDYAIDHPINTATMLWGGVKAGGAGAARLPGVRRFGVMAPGRRTISLTRLGDPDVAPQRIDVGPRSTKNVVDRAVEAGVDAARGRSAFLQRRLQARPVETLVRDQMAADQAANQAARSLDRVANRIMTARGGGKQIRVVIEKVLNDGYASPREKAAEWRNVAAERRAAAAKAAERGDEVRAWNLAKQADQLEVRAAFYDELQKPWERFVAKPRNKALVDRYVAELQARQPAQDAAVESMGIEPTNPRDQLLMAHEREVRDRLAAVRAESAQEILAAREARDTALKEASQSLTPSANAARAVARRARRVVREKDKVAYQGLRDRLARAKHATRRAQNEFEREAVAAGKGRRKAQTDIEHVEMIDTPEGMRVVGAKRVGPASWELRRNLFIEQVDGGWRVRVGSAKNGWSKTFESSADAGEAARSLDGIALGPKTRATTIERRVAQRHMPRGLATERLASAGMDEAARDLATDRGVTSRIGLRRQELRDAIEHERTVAAELADFEARSIDDRTMSDLATELAQRAGMSLAEVSDVRAAVRRGVNVFDDPRLAKYRTPEIDRYYASREAVDAARQRAQDRQVAERSALADEIVQRTGVEPFYVPQTAANFLRGKKAGQTRKSLSTTTQSLYQGREQARTGALVRQGRDSLEPLAVDAFKQAMVAPGELAAMERFVESTSIPTKVGETYPADQYVAFQTGGDKSILSPRMREAFAAADSVKALADAFGVELPQGTLRQAYQATLEVRDAPGTTVKDGAIRVNEPNVRVIPKAQLERLVRDRAIRAAMSPNQKGLAGGVNKTSRGVRMILLNTTLGTLLRNTGGAGAQTVLSGGASPRSVVDLARTYRVLATGQGVVPLSAARTFGRGLVGAQEFKMQGGIGQKKVKVGPVSVRPLHPVALWMDTLRMANTMAEDAGRLLTLATKERAMARGDAMKWWERAIERFGYTNDAYVKVLDDLRNGRDPRSEDLLREVDKWHGDMVKVSAADPILSNTLAFHRWYAHMLRMTFLTLPIEHPGRAHLVQQLGQQGEEYVRRYGIDPPWLNDSFVVRAYVDPPKGERTQERTVIESIGLAGYNPLSTVSQMFRTDKQGAPDLATTMALLQPQYNAAVTFLTGKDLTMIGRGQTGKDEFGNEIGAFSGASFLMGLNRLQRMIPPLNQIDPQTGKADTSNIFRPRAKWEDMDRAEEAGVPGSWERDTPRPPEFRTPVPEENLANFLRRFVGAGPRYYEVEGPGAAMQLARVRAALKSGYGRQLSEAYRRQDPRFADTPRDEVWNK